MLGDNNTVDNPMRGLGDPDPCMRSSNLLLGNSVLVLVESATQQPNACSNTALQDGTCLLLTDAALSTFSETWHHPSSLLSSTRASRNFLSCNCSSLLFLVLLRHCISFASCFIFHMYVSCSLTPHNPRHGSASVSFLFIMSTRSARRHYS